MCGGGEGEREREREGGGERGERGLLYTHISGWSRVADALSRPAPVQPGSLCAHLAQLATALTLHPSITSLPHFLPLHLPLLLPNGIEYARGLCMRGIEQQCTE